MSDERISAIVGNRVHQAHVPQELDGPWIWYGRSGSEGLDTLDGDGPGQFYHFFDVELISKDLDDPQLMAAYIFERMNGKKTIGSETFKGVFIREHNDEYIPHGVMDDSGWHVAALRAEVIP